MKKIIRIDASVLKQSSCLLKLWRIAVEGYRSKWKYNDTEFGSAVHVYCKEAWERKPHAEAKAAAMGYFIEKLSDPHIKVRPGAELLSVPFLELVCNYLDKNMPRDFTPLEVDGEVLVEKNFEIPYYETDSVSIRLTGTIDIIGRLNNGMFCIGDYKTTRQWNHTAFLEPFVYNIQLPFYLHAIQWLGDKYPQGIFGDLAKNRVGCFIEGIFFSEKDFVQIKRSSIWTFSDRRIEVIKTFLDDLCTRLEFYANAKTEPNKEGLVNDTCIGKFVGGKGYPCEFLGSCMAPNDDATQTILGNSFKKVEYNPLDFRK